MLKLDQNFQRIVRKVDWNGSAMHLRLKVVGEGSSQVRRAKESTHPYTRIYPLLKGLRDLS